MPENEKEEIISIVQRKSNPIKLYQTIVKENKFGLKFKEVPL